MSRLFSEKAADVRGRIGSAESVIDVHHRDARAAGIEHPEQGGDAAETGAVADARGHGDDGLADKAGDGAGEGAFHPGGHNDGVARLEPIPYGDKPVNACDADVADAVHAAAEGLEGDGGFFGDGDVRCPGADYADYSNQGGQGTADDGDAARGRMETGIGQLGEYRLEVLRGGPGAEHDAIRIQKRARDAEHLLRELAGAENDLGEAAPVAPVGIYACETEVDEAHGFPSGSTRG